MRHDWRYSVCAAAALALAVAVCAPARAATPDAWITTKVKMTLLTTSGVHANAINVDTIDGRVTLHGTVDTANEKAKAELAARQVQGVRAVRDLLQVVAPTRQDAVAANDEQIKSNVAAALKRDRALDESDIDVASVNAGTVVLSGKAKTMTAHLRALEIASAVPGVRAVASEITGPDTLSDSEIWHDTKESARQAGNTVAGAARDSAAAVGDASKKVAHGAAEAGKSAAGSVADAGRAATGTMTDAWITSAAKVRLMANSQTPASDINVDTDEGRVTLFGSVPTAAAKRAAEAEVREVSGVRSVKNELTIVPARAEKAVAASDADIRTRVENRLEKDAAIGHDIDVEVSNGTVRLTGTVGSQSERLQALTIARATDGVRSVVDSLRVDATHASR
ncbi:BON domain-containing protein [bacterium]|nr:BON domain-containing protein [bacterium]